MKISSFAQIVFLAAILSLLTCRSPNSPPVFRAPNGQTPVTTGIIITGESDPTELGRFGKPNPNPEAVGDCEPQLFGESSLIEKFHLYTPYPNPDNGSQTIHFSVQCSTRVTIFVTPASFLSPENEIVRFANGAARQTGGLAVSVVFDRFAAPGIYSAIWGSRDADGRNLPDGFYRIYLKTDDILLWQDTLLARDPCNLPPVLNLLGEGGCR